MSANYLFKDRSRFLYGRKQDIDFILSRAPHKGITAVVGRPKMGKTWLLQEAGRRLAETNYLVGYHECLGEGDQFLRVLSNLYSRWLSDATNFGQARSLWERQKSSFITSAGTAVGALFSGLAACNGVPDAIAKLVKESFQGLAAADADLKTGGLSLPPLPYEQSQELISVLNKISGQPVVLIFDAWEQSPSLEVENRYLNAFLSHAEDWPQCHLIMGVRHPELKASDHTDRAYAVVQDLEKSALGAMQVYDLPPMQLNDPVESHNLIAQVRRQIAQNFTISDADILTLLGGYPGVLNAWLSDAQVSRIKTEVDLQALAADAQSYRYREFNLLLPKLSLEQKIIAIRLAFFPRLDRDTWLSFRAIILSGCRDLDLDELNIQHILDTRAGNADTFPTYGHDTRHGAARRWFLEKPEYRGILTREVSEIIFRLAEKVTRVDAVCAPFVIAIRNVAFYSLGLKLDDQVGILVASALSVLGEQSSRAIKSGAAGAVAKDRPAVAPLLSFGLLNTLVNAKDENDLARRDGLLEDLRTLADAHPAEPALREQWAKGLYKTLNHATDENNLARRDALLEDLRTLAAAHPAEPALREELAKGLFNTLYHAKDENDLARWDALLEDLRTLAAAHPAEPALREWWAKGLHNTLNHPKAKNDFARRHALLKDLRTLAAAHPAEPALREPLARSLVNTLIYAKAENDLARRDALLKDLRTLAAAHPAKPALREPLAKGLLNTLIDAKDENNPARRDALLKDLQTLAAAHPDEPALREPLARGLLNVLVQTATQNDLQQAETLLRELRILAPDLPETVPGLMKMVNRAP